MCYGRKDYEEAERLYRRAVEVAPNDAKTVCQLARFLTRTGKDAGEAEPLFRRALELDPNDARINCTFAMYLKHDRKDYDEAEQLFRARCELAPNDAGINFSSAVFFHHARQDYAAAESFYRKAVELRPNDAYNSGAVIRNIGGRITPGLVEQLGLLGRMAQLPQRYQGAAASFISSCFITPIAASLVLPATPPCSRTIFK